MASYNQRDPLRYGIVRQTIDSQTVNGGAPPRSYAANQDLELARDRGCAAPHVLVCAMDGATAS